MRKKIRQALAELSQECTALSHQEMVNAVGGDRYYFDSSGMLIDKKESTDNVAIVGDNTLALYGSLSGYDATDKNEQYKCTYYTGDGVSDRLFEFLANNTDVEWCYAYNPGESGGVMATSRQEYHVNYDSDDIGSTYSHRAHSHGQKVNGMSQEELEQFNSLPSSQDIKNLKDGAQGQIYNEITGEWCDFAKGSKTQEDWLIANGFRLNQRGDGWERI